jgi:hypothetical protein
VNVGLAAPTELLVKFTRTEVPGEAGFGVTAPMVGAGGFKNACPTPAGLMTPALDVSVPVHTSALPFVAKPVWLGQATEPSPSVPELVGPPVWAQSTCTVPPLELSPTVESEADVGLTAVTVTVGAAGAE